MTVDRAYPYNPFQSYDYEWMPFDDICIFNEPRRRYLGQIPQTKIVTNRSDVISIKRRCFHQFLACFTGIALLRFVKI